MILRRHYTDLVLFAVLLATFWFGVSVQAATLLNHDLGWIVRSAGQMLAGARFGSDILEPNLPTAWYLAMPAAWLHDALGFDEIMAFRAWTWFVVAVCLGAFWLVVASGSSPNKDRTSNHLALFSLATAACVLVGYSFGQREHLAFVLSAPYVALVGRRSGGDRVPAQVAVLSGCLAGVGFSLKPFFLAVALLVEGALAISLGRSWTALRAETAALVVTGMVFLAAIFLYSPDYLSSAVPLIKAVYWAYDASWDVVLDGANHVLTFTFALVVLMLLTWRSTTAARIWLAAGLGWILSFIVQRKGFTYHSYPIVATGVVLAGIVTPVVLGELYKAARAGTARIRIALLVTCLLLMLSEIDQVIDQSRWWYADYNAAAGAVARPRVELIEALRSQGAGPGSTIYALGTHPFPAFPTVNYLGAIWLGSSPCLFTAPAWLRRAEEADQMKQQAIDQAFAVQRDEAREVLSRKPDFVLVDVGSRKFGLAYRPVTLLTLVLDPAQLAGFHRDYEEHSRAGPIAIFSLRQVEGARP